MARLEFGILEKVRWMDLLTALKVKEGGWALMIPWNITHDEIPNDSYTFSYFVCTIVIGGSWWRGSDRL